MTHRTAPERLVVAGGTIALAVAGLLNLVPAALTVPYKTGRLRADPVTEASLAVLVERTGWPQLTLWFAVALGYLVVAVMVARRDHRAWRFLLLIIAADAVNYALVWSSGVYASFRGVDGLVQDAFLYLCVVIGAVVAHRIATRRAL